MGVGWLTRVDGTVGEGGNSGRSSRNPKVRETEFEIGERK